MKYEFEYEEKNIVIKAITSKDVLVKKIELPAYVVDLAIKGHELYLEHLNKKGSDEISVIK